ncbi:ATP-grasp domain-containing protein [Bacillus massiliglaciei]|uniref:ATP-grasp domain-containing protein n=1 Tax=Bacillus massiliglaciei TaxID=1816693 RepID=UPI000DA5F6C0|nr:ATP-grasp domain-containing protein [Bacillus massiliglaciei]
MTLTGWLIYHKNDAEKNKSYIQWMLEEANDLGMEVHLLFREDIQAGHDRNGLKVMHQKQAAEWPDFAIVRCIDPLFTRQLELLGIDCYNSSFVSEMANHKARMHQYLNTYSIPMIDTLYCAGHPSKESVPYRFPYIVKEVHGRGGRNVYMIQKETELAALPEGRDWLIQKPAVTGRDIRVFVVGGEIIAAVLRESSSDFKANFTLGGSASLYALSEEETALVRKIIGAFDQLGMVGIDFLFAEDGSLLFNEMEDVVGSRTLSSLTDLNIVRKYLQFIKSRHSKKG